MVYSNENFYKIFEYVRKSVPYKVCIKAIEPDEILLRSSIKDLDEAAIFIQAFECVTNSQFKTDYSQNSPICRGKWVCTVVNGSGKCPANIKIHIKTMNKINTMRDAYLNRDPPHRAVIRVNPHHNHRTSRPAPSKVVKMNNGVKECFYEYFKRGYIGARAKELHEQSLSKANFFDLEDESMNPKLSAISALYNQWLSNKNEKAKVQVNTGERGVQMKDCFFEYFRRGYYGLRAKLLHEHILSKAKFFNLKDESMNPKLKAISTFYKEWLSNKNGSVQEDAVFYNVIRGPTFQPPIIMHGDINNAIAQSSSENFENFINVEDVLSRLKKEPVDEDDDFTNEEMITDDIVEDNNPVLNIDEVERHVLPLTSNTAPEIITGDIVEDINPILNIKQEINNEVERHVLPVTSNTAPEIITGDIVEDINPVLSIKQEIIEEDANEFTSGDIVEDINPVLSIKQEIIEEDANEFTSDNATEFISGGIVEDIKPILNIKQEKIDDDDESNVFPVISSYGSLAVKPISVLPSQSLSNTKSAPKQRRRNQPKVAPVAEKRTLPKIAPVEKRALPKMAPAVEKRALPQVTPVVKAIMPSPSQVVVYDQSSNTYKIVKCVTVKSGTYSSSQYKSYLPNTSLPARISL